MAIGTVLLADKVFEEARAIAPTNEKSNPQRVIFLMVMFKQNVKNLTSQLVRLGNVYFRGFSSFTWDKGTRFLSCRCRLLENLTVLSFLLVAVQLGKQLRCSTPVGVRLRTRLRGWWFSFGVSLGGPNKIRESQMSEYVPNLQGFILCLVR